MGEADFVGTGVITGVGEEVGAGVAVEIKVGRGDGDRNTVGTGVLINIFGKKITPAKMIIIKTGAIVFTH